MFSYYGRKTKVVKYYPRPEFNTIIEPFAGSAAYSLHGDNWKHNVIIVDKYEVVYRVWRYLQQSSEQSILSLPDVEYGHSTKEHAQLCEEEVWLIGFCVARGSAQPQYQSGKFNSWPDNKKSIARNLYKIRHWDIRLGDYRDIDNFEATWFIDPPYQWGGQYYTESNKSINFPELSEWCKSRIGQVIVCENTKADWMPFHPIKKMRGNKHVTTEAMWTNRDIPRQLSMFDSAP